jgi:triosephosphate isomerase (TIM)
MRTKIVAGNWKMNKSFEEADELINNIIDQLKDEDLTGKAVIICPPAVFLELATDQAYDNEIYVGAQNVSCYESGAYTGEVSASMLNSMGVEFCIIGHSERRKYFKETHDDLALKVNLSIKNNVAPIFCCGEILPEREAGKHFEVVKMQLQESLFYLNKGDFDNVIIAYEPVWAIGTGMNATADQAQEMHHFIRNLIKEKYGEEIADNLCILYGGSCNSKNAAELFSNPDVDGGLIGGASLDATEFIKIIQSF